MVINRTKIFEWPTSLQLSQTSIITLAKTQRRKGFSLRTLRLGERKHPFSLLSSLIPGLTKMISNPVTATPIALLVLLLVSLPLQAAEIRVNVDHDPVGLNETFTLTYELNQSSDSPPDFTPLHNDFDLINQGRSSSTSWINGKFSSSIKWKLVLRPLRAGKLKIPPVQFGSDTSTAMEITAIEAAKFRPQRDNGSNHIAIEVEASPESAYVQQQIIYTMRLLLNTNISRDSTLSAPQLKGANATIQQIGKDTQYTTQRNGSNWQVIERRYAVTPMSSGVIDFEPAHFEGQLIQQQQRPQQSDPFFNMFNTMRGPVKHLFSDPLSVEVKPQPADFTGKLWLPASKLEIHGKWSTPHDELKTGEPATLTITVEADGLSAEQLPSPEMTFPAGLKSYDDQPKRRDDATKSGIKGVLLQKIAVVPTRAGSYSIPAIEIPWWNINTSKMEMARLDAIDIKASGADVSAAASQPQSSTPQAEQPSSSPQTESAAVPQTSQWWKMAALIFALLWILTIAVLLWYFKLRKPKLRKPVDGNARKPLLDSLEAATQFGKPRRRKVLQAARSNDPQATRNALLKWGESVFPEVQIHSLSSLAQQLDGELATEVEKLNLSLYSIAPGEWSGSELAESILKWRESKNQDQNKQSEQLPPLNKL